MRKRISVRFCKINRDTRMPLSYWVCFVSEGVKPEKLSIFYKPHLQPLAGKAGFPTRPGASHMRRLWVKPGILWAPCLKFPA